jgi:ABC-type dipeptide/oligopeptide/nickel transport system permease subunit
MAVSVKRFMGARPAQRPGAYRRVWPAPLVGWLLLFGLAVIAVTPSTFAAYDPTRIVARPLSRPSLEHPLGTNDIGQDLLSELIWGTRVSLTTGLAVAVAAVAVGTGVGIISGYFGGWGGSFLMRLVDLVLVLPFLPLVILLGSYLGPSQRNVVLVLILVSWAGPARMVRAQVLTMLPQPYMEAARALGSSDFDIMVRHIWPGVRLIVLAQLILVASLSILAEASLSFLGLGDLSAKSWGTMLYFARASGAFLGSSWQWWVLPAGLMIAISLLSLVLISLGLEGKVRGQGR